MQHNQDDTDGARKGKWVSQLAIVDAGTAGNGTIRVVDEDSPARSAAVIALVERVGGGTAFTRPEPCLLRNGRGALNGPYLHDHGALRVPATVSRAAPGTVGLAGYGVGAFTFGPRDRYAARRHCLRSALSGAYE